MRKINAIISIRGRKDLKTRSWDIVFEWEDIIADRLGIVIKNESSSLLSIVLQKLHLYKFVVNLLKSKNLYLRFVTDVKLIPGQYASPNMIPIIIDFWYEKKEINKFIEHFKFVPLLFVTNKEVQNLLSVYECPFKVEHFPLSLPDQYRLTKDSLANKDFEFCFVGRIDKFFLELVEEYAAKHEDFEYVYSKGISVNREFWTNKGKFLGKDAGRESYIEFLRRTKISSYSTPGMDATKKANFNQVTPRLLEMLANGCQVIGHYPESEDVLWYNLSSVVPNVTNFESFESILDDMRKKSFDFEKISKFLSNHYTSNSAQLLYEVLEKYSLLK